MTANIFFNSVSSKQLNENFSKHFGSKVNLEKYSREQLEDMRNKLRTRVFQQEGSTGYTNLLSNESYQKDKAMLQLLNTRIKEMLGEDIKKLRDKMVELSESKNSKNEGAKLDFLDLDKDGNKKEPMKRAVADKKKKTSSISHDDVASESVVAKKDKVNAGKKAMSTKDKKVSEVSKGTLKSYIPKAEKDFKDKINNNNVSKETSKQFKKDLDNREKGMARAATRLNKDIDESGTPMSKNKKFAAVKKSKDMQKKQTNENFRRSVRLVNESLAYYIAEDEEGKAKAITAASDMVNDFTSWMQRVGQYQTKAIIELADAIRADFGLQQAEAFKTAVAPALAATLETLTQQRETISNAVATLAGEDVPPEEQIGVEPAMGPVEPEMDVAGPDEMNPEPSDEFAAADAAAGGSEVSGREVRESKIARKLSESHSIISKLAR